MKNIYQLIAVLFGLITTVIQVNAAHIIGGEMTYVCEGVDPDEPNSRLYTFTLKVYRDCNGNGAEFDSPMGQVNGTVSIFRGSSNQEFRNIQLGFPVITTIDNEGSNPCVTVPPDICGETGVYTFFISLPVSVESYYIVYQRCCRNNTINNINNPGQSGSTYSVELTPTAQSVCNSSPTFTNLPETVLCVNTDLNVDNSAFDADGDQLVYSFCSPLLGGSTNIVAPNPDAPPPYNEVQFILPNYTPDAPFGGDPVVTINSFTGAMTGVVTEQGQYVVGICVQEFRNGELLSTIQRDYQFNVEVCNPVLEVGIVGADIGPQGTYIYQQCVDSTFVFINESVNMQAINEYEWTFDLGAGNQPLSFSTRDVTVTFPGPGFYTGQMVINPGTECSGVADLEITVTPPINPSFEYTYDTCIAGPVDFVDLTANMNSTIANWDWDFGDGGASTEVSPTYMYEDPGNWPVSLTVTDSIGCIETVSNVVTWFPVPPLLIIEPSTFVGCPPAEVEFVNLSTPIDDTYDIQWDFGDGGVDTMISPFHTYERPGVFNVSIEITSPIGCYTSREFPNWIEMDSLPIANFTFSPDKANNFEPEVTFTDQSIRAVEWDWTFGQFGGTIAQNPTYVFPDTGLMEIQLVITHKFGCVDTMIQYVDVEPQVTYFLPNAFTPNGDGKNEFFRGGGFFRGIRDFNMIVMNRWGGVVFESRDPSEGWNGQKNNTGKMSPNGVYLVYVSYTGPRGMPKEYKGYATLIR